jgi:hypothetical protein
MSARGGPAYAQGKGFKCRTCGKVFRHAAAMSHKYAYKGHDISGNKNYLTDEPLPLKGKGGWAHRTKETATTVTTVAATTAPYRCRVCSKEFTRKGQVYYHISGTKHGKGINDFKTGGTTHGTTSTTTHQRDNAASQATRVSTSNPTQVSEPPSPPDTLIAYLFGKVEEIIKSCSESASVPTAPVASRVGELLQRSAGRGLLGSKHRMPGM